MADKESCFAGSHSSSNSLRFQELEKYLEFAVFNWSQEKDGQESRSRRHEDNKEVKVLF